MASYRFVGWQPSYTATQYKDFEAFMRMKTQEASKVCPVTGYQYGELRAKAQEAFEYARAGQADAVNDKLHDLEAVYKRLKVACNIEIANRKAKIAAGDPVEPINPYDTGATGKYPTPDYSYEPETPTPMPTVTPTPPSIVVPTTAPKMGGVGWLAIIGGLIAGYYLYKNR